MGRRYGESRRNAENSVRALALRVIADRIEHGELDGELSLVRFWGGSAA